MGKVIIEAAINGNAMKEHNPDTHHFCTARVRGLGVGLC